ncbi:DNA repair protein RecN [Spirochaeta cellobiosiphila]|uniref:DNA repair protein RecN n=1 Tax=Spirochaeta cellobiosiphila TaxID=504483 RepID=UPI000421A416|nr:DNA repair protein RecN [Spirochaeta cellobiosiphila]
MLVDISIKNYALIENQHLSFNEGFNILSGETGAGKSILIGAIGLLLGEKGEQEKIRTGAESASVIGTFTINSNKAAIQWLRDHDIECEDNNVIIKRVIKNSGRGSSYIQSEPVTVKDLQEFTGLIIDVHSQHSHQSLFNKDNHRKLLDRFGGCDDLAKRVTASYHNVNDLRTKYNDYLENQDEYKKKYEEQIRLIKDVEITDIGQDEERELTQERSILLRGEDIYRTVKNITDISTTKSDSLFGLSTVRQLMSKLVDIDQTFESLYNRYESSYYEIEDILENLKTINIGLDFSPERMEFVESRINSIHGILKKYGPTYDLMMENYNTAKQYTTEYKDSRHQQLELEQEISEAEEELGKIARLLSQKRKMAATELELQIVSNLKQLGMEKVEFKIEFSNKMGTTGKTLCGPLGYDVIEFMISTNIGEPLKSLKSVASGGELSRVMLALKSVLADSDDISTLIFDEIDTGIGGSVALALGKHLKELSKSKQVFSITHLATIASFAQKHIKIEKEVKLGHTYTKVRELVAEDRVEEVSRMLSGTSNDESAINHARKLILENSQ